jgi:hypothetical protein
MVELVVAREKELERFGRVPRVHKVEEACRLEAKGSPRFQEFMGFIHSSTIAETFRAPVSSADNTVDTSSAVRGKRLKRRQNSSSSQS